MIPLSSLAVATIGCRVRLITTLLMHVRVADHRYQHDDDDYDDHDVEMSRAS